MMNKRENYVELELSGERLDSLVFNLRDRLLKEFWAHVPEGEYLEQIKARLEKNILGALNSEPEAMEAT
jgi:hypothetical protein